MTLIRLSHVTLESEQTRAKRDPVHGGITDQLNKQSGFSINIFLNNKYDEFQQPIYIMCFTSTAAVLTTGSLLNGRKISDGSTSCWFDIFHFRLQLYFAR